MLFRLSALAELDPDDIIDRFNLLAEQPGMGRARPESGRGVRSFVVENYVIYYRQEDDVLIARILHERRDQLAAWSDGAKRGPTAAAARRDPVASPTISVPRCARNH